MNLFDVMNNIDKYIKILEEKKSPYYRSRLLISDVCNDLSIFDWWNEYISISQLKQMKGFLNTASKMGYNGYVCFKVGAKYCSHGMWAHKNESTDGYSPDGEFLFHSFRCGDNYWDCRLPNGQFLADIYKNRHEFTLKEVKNELLKF